MDSNSQEDMEQVYIWLYIHTDDDNYYYLFFSIFFSIGFCSEGSLYLMKFHGSQRTAVFDRIIAPMHVCKKKKKNENEKNVLGDHIIHLLANEQVGWMTTTTLH